MSAAPRSRIDVDVLLDAVGLERPAWMRDAACRGLDPSLFYGTRDAEGHARIRAARLVCEECPVRVECLDHAVDRPERLGVWGGTSERQRRQIRHQRRRQPA